MVRWTPSYGCWWLNGYPPKPFYIIIVKGELRIMNFIQPGMEWWEVVVPLFFGVLVIIGSLVICRIKHGNWIWNLRGSVT